jgi:hypothetical protein
MLNNPMNDCMKCNKVILLLKKKKAIIGRFISRHAIGASVIVICISIACAFPIAQAFQIGGDEGMELGKAFQLGGDSSWKANLWNDQPPAYTILIAAMFHIFGPKAWAARILTILFFGLLLFSVAALMPRGRLRIAGIVGGWITLLALPSTIELGIGAMLELPAYSLAYASLALLLAAPKELQRQYILISGCAFGLALSIKFTALLVAPACLLAIILRDYDHKNGKYSFLKRAKVNEILLWATLCGITCSSIFVMSQGQMGNKPWSQLWFGHWYATQSPVFEDPNAFRMDFNNVFGDFWLYGILFVAAWIVRYRENPRVWVLLCALLTTTIVHLGHRPYWYYYQLHISIPLACLVGLACADICRSLFKVDSSGRNSGFVWAAALLALCLYIPGSLRALHLEISKCIYAEKTIDKSVIVREMRRYASETKWIYSRNNTYSFHAKVPILPNLLLLPYKRFWSGQIDEKKIFEEVTGARPQQLVLSWIGELTKNDWQEFASVNYIHVVNEGDWALFVAKELRPVSLLNKPGEPGNRTPAMITDLGLGWIDNKTLPKAMPNSIRQ